MSSLDDILAGMDAWSTAQVYKKPVAKVAAKPAAKAPPPPMKKVLKKRKIDQHFEKIPAPESEKRKKASDLLQSLLKPQAQPYVSPLGDEPLILTPQHCELAVQEIMRDKKRNQIIAVDCEGVNLGRNGRLCLVQIATPSKPYLFDIIEGGPAIFDSGLRRLLEDKDVMKVMHDCRLDSDALFHEHKVSLTNVFDTQVAFAIVARGKGQSTPLPVGLNTLLRHYAHGASNEVKDHMKQAMQADSEYWLKRPMDENALKYARQDVTFLCTVQRQIDAVLSVATRKNVAFYSNHYVELYRKLEEAIVREAPKQADGIIERYVPKYGITEWDMDCALNLERSAGRKRK